ncbi:MAG: M67 family metallopeptidase [Chitinophagaceae bacterium]|nr:M67 family metallopeptidase [Chitinophagaceae bacterium]
MISIEKEAEKIMFEDAVKAFPDECCGFMFGNEEGESRTVSKALPVYNSATENRKRRFVIAPKDYMNAEKFADENNLQFLGIYHSHPNHPAIPSEHDRIAAQPWFSYVIISVSPEGVQHTRSWLLNEQFQFEEEQYNTQLINSIK